MRDGRPCLSVADSGPGIPADERERVFARFYRAAEAPPSTGSGLGLAIVRAVAQRHQAVVKLDDAPGGGLLVSCEFPAA
jgi:signal transduction histidine kinase